MNLQDYVRWRGDLTFAERGFTIVDNLALAALSYLDLAGIVPTTGDGSISMREAAQRLIERREQRLDDPEMEYEAQRLPIVDVGVMADLGASARFGDARLSDFVDVLDPGGGAQFSAVTIHLDDGSVYVSYRGTDWTILGWHEDFTMSFEIIPAQLAAARYLRDRAAAAAGDIRVGGHSKGGNLAVYAAMSLAEPVQDRLLAIYSNDGPGLAPEIVDLTGLDRIRDRLVKIIPEFAVVGLLFDTGEGARIVRSDAPGVLQHYITSWQVQGDDLVEVDQIEPRAAVVKTAFDEWLEAVGPDERRSFTNDFFEALTAGGATLITQVGHQDFGGFESVLVTFGRHRGETRRAVWLGWRAVLRAVADINYRNLLRHAETVRALVVAGIGLFFVVQPVLGAEIVSSLGLVVLYGVLAAVGAAAALRPRGRRPSRRRVAVVVVLLAVALVVALLLQRIIDPSNVLFGLLLVGNAWFAARRGVAYLRGHRLRRLRSGLWFLSAIISLTLGVVVLSNARTLLPDVVQHTGQYLLVAGLLEAFLILRDEVGRGYASAAAVVRMRLEKRALPWGAQPVARRPAG